MRGRRDNRTMKMQLKIEDMSFDHQGEISAMKVNGYTVSLIHFGEDAQIANQNT